MDPYLNIFDEPVRFNRRHRRAGYSTTAVVVTLALLVVVLLVWWQVSAPTNNLMVGDDPAVLLDGEMRNDLRNNNGNVNNTRELSQAELATVRLRTRAELNAIEARLEAEQDYGAALQSLEELESDLEDTYAQTTGAARENWEEIKFEFDELQDRLREGSADSLALLGDLIRSFEADVRVDEEE
jgi:hypothetical protein